MQEFYQIRTIIKKMRTIIGAMKTRRVKVEDIQNIQQATEDINRFLYHAERLKIQKKNNLKNEDEYWSYVEETEKLILLWEKTLERRDGKKSVDVMFWDIYEYFKYVDENTIYQAVIRHFLELPEEMHQIYLSLPQYTFLHNRLDYTQSDFSLIDQHVKMMADEVEKYKWLYEHLADYRSKRVLNGIICYWFDFDLEKMHNLCDITFSDYYDLDILKCNEDEVIVDLGAFIGDSVQDYINTYGTYKKIYAYEITPSTYETLVKNVSMYPNIIPVNKGVSNKAREMFVFDDGYPNLGNRLSETGNMKIEVVTLDEDIMEPITLIKMDIEGAEKDAIRGAVSHIKADRPKMAISSYHLPEDIFEIPCLINSIRDDYKFYMRFNGFGSIWPCDYVLFAV